MIGQLKAVSWQFRDKAAEHQQSGGGHGPGRRETGLFNQFVSRERTLTQSVKQGQFVIGKLVAQGL